MTRFGYILCVAVLAVLAQAASARADKLSRAEIGRRGKAATALVEVPGRGSGTAFCVHPSGLFVTNEHVIRGKEKSEIKLVIDANLKTQRVLTAAVIRSDRDLDLALLRVVSGDKFPSVPLGSDQDVAELTDVVAFGFPLGAALSPDRKEYPAITVSAGNVSSVRRKDGQLHRIQIDVSVTFGNSGGPVLDENGQVVGVVVAGVAGQRGLNQAIPVSHVSRFVKLPDIQFTPPELTRGLLNKPVEFKARAVSVLPGAKAPTLRLILQTGEEKAREFPMTVKGGAYSATAVPVLKTNDGRLELSVRLGDGAVSGQADDIAFKFNGKPMKLSQVRRVQFTPKPTVVLTTGKSVEGEIAGLRAVDILVGGQKIKLDLGKAIQIQVQPVFEVALVTATIVAELEGNEVARIRVPIPIQDALQAAAADPSSVPIVPPALADARVIKRLPEPFADVCLGGGGRYLVFQLPRLRRLAVFDVNEARITGYLPLAEDKVSFAAGLESVVIGLPKKGVLERWSLRTFELETTAFPPFTGEIQRVLMGHLSNGPLVVNGVFLDLASLKPLPITYAKDGWGPSAQMFLSGDGSVFCRWGQESVAYVVESGLIKEYRAGALGHVIPGPDGRMIFTARGIVNARFNRVDANDASYGYCLPAVRGNYFLSLSPADGAKGGGLAIYLLGYPRPLARLEIAHGLRFDSRDREPFGAWQRIFLIPDANTVVVLPESNDQVVLHQFDVEAALEKSGVNYLLVTSQPPRIVKEGELFRYAVVVKAMQPPISFKLETGPKGMEVSKGGIVTWKTSIGTAGRQEEVVVTVGDAQGQEVFHTFGIRVEK
jgi:S1-C subfamily serine protease